VLASVIEDLIAEEAALASLLATLAPEEWDLPTPAAGWAVRDQIAHLALAEDLATLAATDPGAFKARLVALMSDLESVEADNTKEARSHSPGELTAWWKSSASATIAAIRDRDDGDRVAWITGPMSVVSFATARLMETWAHGHDVAEAVGASVEATARLRHVADLGVRTRGFSFRNRGLQVPDVEPRVELRGPDGRLWTWGPEDATERVEGDALDFCLVVTQRRPVTETTLKAIGAGPTAWLAIAQCFAGPPTSTVT
jgi:uncharacterized protein (TIGR03084 family)